MIRKTAQTIVKWRKAILVLCALMAVASILTITKVNVNYDFTDYLSDDTLTRRSLEMMNAEFGTSEQLRVMFIGRDDITFEKSLAEIRAMDEVMNASYNPDTGKKIVDGERCQLVNLTLNECDSVRFVETLRGKFTQDGDYVVAGMAANMLDVQEKLVSEVSVAMIIALIVVLLVLLITSRAWAEPIPIFIVLVVSILVNMGTNWVFGTISFVTFAVCAILQLALSMDYAIMLLHMYDELRDSGLNDLDAMTEAMTRSFMPVTSSALTTVAGLLSLMFMSFTIGFDIGIVLSKGIMVSLLIVFVLMPALILSMPNLLRKTSHKPMPMGGKHVARFAAKARIALPIVMIAVIGVSVYLQTGNQYTFTDEGSQETAQRVASVFGESNNIAVLVPSGTSDADYDKQRELVRRISEIQFDGRAVVTDVQAMVTTGAQALTYYTAADVSEMFNTAQFMVNMFFKQHGFEDSVRADALVKAAAEYMPDNETVLDLKSQLDAADKAFNGEKHARMVLTMDMPFAGQGSYEVIDSMVAVISEMYGDDFGVVGSSVSSYDISSAFTGDLTKVNVITVAAILLIIALSFRSISIPVMLVCVIQGAIHITMAIYYVRGQSIFFMSYLICVAMQMGATVDYGILLTSNYRQARADFAPKDALEHAVALSLPTICTSGLILVMAGFIVGKVCSVFYISSIGMLLALGASISIVLVLTLLPSLLMLLDKYIVKLPAGR